MSAGKTIQAILDERKKYISQSITPEGGEKIETLCRDVLNGACGHYLSIKSFQTIEFAIMDAVNAIQTNQPVELLQPSMLLEFLNEVHTHGKSEGHPFDMDQAFGLYRRIKDAGLIAQDAQIIVGRARSEAAAR